MSVTQARTIRIRRGTHADLNALLALEQASFDHDRLSRTQFRRHIGSDSAAVLVIARAGSVQAATVVFFRRGSRSARLYSIAVSESARGLGYGAALLKAVERQTRRHGCDTMKLEVRTDNRAAIALYESRGYRRSERLAGFYEDGSDAWRYTKALAPVMPR